MGLRFAGINMLYIYLEYIILYDIVTKHLPDCVGTKTRIYSSSC